MVEFFHSSEKKQQQQQHAGPPPSGCRRRHGLPGHQAAGSLSLQRCEGSNQAAVAQEPGWRLLLSEVPLASTSKHKSTR